MAWRRIDEQTSSGAGDMGCSPHADMGYPPPVNWGEYPILGASSEGYFPWGEQLVNCLTQPILLVEDDDDDERLMRHALNEAGVPNAMIRVADGQKAIDYLAGIGSYSDRSAFPIPFLILLDLHLPSKSGLDVLEWIHGRPEFRSLVVILLLASAQSKEVALAYQLGARSYLVKPPTSQQLKELVESLKTCWVGYDAFPRIPPPKRAES